MLPKSRSTPLSWSRTPCSRCRALSIASTTFAPPGWQIIRARSPCSIPIRPRVLPTASAKLRLTNSGIERSKTTPKPSVSTSHPMMARVSGQVYSPPVPKTAPVWLSVERHAAAAPSPKSTVAMISAFCRRSARNDSVQVSTHTKSTLLPGAATARREARDSPETPAAQPRPNTGTR